MGHFSRPQHNTSELPVQIFPPRGLLMVMVSLAVGCGGPKGTAAPELAPQPEPTEQPAPAPSPTPEPAQPGIDDDVACAQASECVATKYPGCCGCSECPSTWYAWSQAWVEREKQCDMVADCVGCVEAIDMECPPEPATPPAAACVDGRCVLVHG